MPKNIYGVTKVAAENLCELLHHRHGLPCLILRTSRFFPEPDDRRETREAYADGNAKANEFLFRRADIADIVDAHLLALEQAAAIGFGRYIVSATTPFTPADLAGLRTDAAGGRRPPRAALRARVCGPRLVDVPQHRPRLRQRAGTPRSGLAAASSTSPASCRTSRQAARRAAP